MSAIAGAAGRARRRVDAARGSCPSPTIASKAGCTGSTTRTVRTNTVDRPRRRRARSLRLRGTRKAHRGEDRLQRPLRATSIRARADASRWPRRRATSPAPAARPMAITNCLNFGNPKRPEVFFQFREAVGGMARGVRGVRHAGHRRQRLALQREPAAAPSIPTPVIGMVGLHRRRRSRHARARSGRPATRSCCSASRPTRSAGQRVSRRVSTAWSPGAPPRCDLERRARAHRRAARGDPCGHGIVGARLQRRRARRRAGRVRDGEPRAHAERVGRPHGVAALPPRALLFGEAQGRVIVSTDSPSDGRAHRGAHGVPARRIGVGRVG